MDTARIRSILIEKLAQSRGVDPRDLESTQVIDSLEGLELAMEAEQNFGVSVSDDELSSALLSSITALAELVRSKQTSPAEDKRKGAQ